MWASSRRTATTRTSPGARPSAISWCVGSIGALQRGLALKFKNGVVGNVCSHDDAQVFDASLPVNGDACAQHAPTK
jgi:hypothetical protein